MERRAQSFDVCVICALPEEVKAFLTVVKLHCEDDLEEHTSPRYGYSYRSATLKNDKNELLALHISWLSRYGPQEMTLHLSRVLEEFQPRIAIMTGICAGDARQVHLGDLIVAERTFTYDNGKFVSDEQGRRVHLHDTLTYQLDANILQFLGLFDDWIPLVAGLETPPPMLDQRKPVCYIKGMASGNAVRADNPFQDVQAPVRGTVAIDMEGAAFGLVMSRYPLTCWLIVKGVCDYADRTKNDTYHDYAACASAAYALRFIQVYVTNERLPRPERPSSSGRVGPSPIWNVPYRRNPLFTGRDELLRLLRDKLATAKAAALTQTQAISGLGGIGKTQIALEYAYRYRGGYHSVFWVRSASRDALIADFVTIADLLHLPEKGEQDQNKVILAVKQWFIKHDGWLLILDNADDVAMLSDFMPLAGKGHIILTSRAQAMGLLAQRIDVERMGMVEGTLFLLRRTKILDKDAFLDRVPEEYLAEAESIVIEMDFLPLALDQAGAYIDEIGCSLSAYLTLYRTHRKELLLRRSRLPTDHPEPVATTWSLSFQKVKQASPAAADLLRLCAFLEPDTISEDLISGGSAHLSPVLQRAATDALKLDRAIEELRKFSLVQRIPDARTLSIHRLVQAVLRDAMKEGTQRRWAERAVRVVNAVFPEEVVMETWPRCQRFLSQVQTCVALIQDYALAFDEAASLLVRTASYLQTHALYELTGPLYQHALLIWEHVRGTEDPNVADVLNDLAILYCRQGKYAEAEPLFWRALNIREQALGSEHSQVAAIVNNLGILYKEQGKYVEAEPLYQRALLIAERVEGSEGIGVARSLNGLANLYKEQGKYAEAEPLIQRSLHIWEQALGPEHPDVVIPLNTLANIYREQSKYPESEASYRRALLIVEQTLGPEHPSAATLFNNLAELFEEQGNYRQADPLYREALRIREQALGSEHYLVASPLIGLANLYSHQGKYAEAEPLYQRALAIRERILGPGHPSTQIARENYAAHLRAMGRDEEQKKLEEKA